MTTTFTSEVRVLVCPRCGAPILSPPAGGHATCRHCGTAIALGPRQLAPPQTSAVDEGARFATLAQQLHIPPPISSLVVLLAGATTIANIPEPRLGRAFATWHGLVERVSRGELGAEEDLFQLTNALNSTIGDRDPQRMRAITETALEAMRSPSKRMEILGMLARAACREGDALGAQGWLAAMDRQSFDLRADSAYRLAHAVYVTLIADFARVLDMLGVAHGHVPIHNQSALLAIVFRANALARLGQLAEGRAELALLPSPTLLPQVLQRWRHMQLWTG